MQNFILVSPPVVLLRHLLMGRKNYRQSTLQYSFEETEVIFKLKPSSEVQPNQAYCKPLKTMTTTFMRLSLFMARIRILSVLQNCETSDTQSCVYVWASTKKRRYLAVHAQTWEILLQRQSIVWQKIFWNTISNALLQFWYILASFTNRSFIFQRFDAKKVVSP